MNWRWTLSGARPLTWSLWALAFAPACGPLQPRTAPALANDAYVFAYFMGNGQDGLHLAAGTDALRFTPLKEGQSFLAPTLGGKLMRDPSVVAGPDGIFHLVWTTGWWDKGIGIAHSKDLVNWSAPAWLPVMEHEPTALNCWAPEIFYDEMTRRYLIFWATTIPGRFPATEPFGDEAKEKGARLNHRIYYTATKDFREYTKTKLFYDGGFNVIDATLVREGARYLLFVKDETRFPEPAKNLRVATGSQADGPFGEATPPFSDAWVEGPSVLKTTQGLLLYYDEYTRHRYGALISTDLTHWTAVSDRLSFPEGARHGSVIRVPRKVVERLRAPVR